MCLCGGWPGEAREAKNILCSWTLKMQSEDSTLHSEKSSLLHSSEWTSALSACSSVLCQFGSPSSIMGQEAVTWKPKAPTGVSRNWKLWRRGIGQMQIAARTHICSSFFLLQRLPVRMRGSTLNTSGERKLNERECLFGYCLTKSSFKVCPLDHFLLHVKCKNVCYLELKVPAPQHKCTVL